MTLSCCRTQCQLDLGLAGLLGLGLASRTRPNPKPHLSFAFSSSTISAPLAADRVREDESGLLSRRLLRLRFRSPRGAAAAAIERWARERVHISQPELRRAIVMLRRARRYEHALEVSSGTFGFSWLWFLSTH